MDEDKVKYISGTSIQPQKYNIVLTRDGDEIEFDFPPATAEQITRFGFLKADDIRCESGVILEEEDLYGKLRPILGQAYQGELAYHTRKQVIISLHDTAILGYQRQTIIDPRISNEIATFWEIYLDDRVFFKANDDNWQNALAEVIAGEVDDDDTDRKLAEDIKDILLGELADDADMLQDA